MRCVSSGGRCARWDEGPGWDEHIGHWIFVNFHPGRSTPRVSPFLKWELTPNASRSLPSQRQLLLKRSRWQRSWAFPGADGYGQKKLPKVPKHDNIQIFNEGWTMLNMCLEWLSGLLDMFQVQKYRLSEWKVRLADSFFEWRTHFVGWMNRFFQGTCSNVPYVCNVSCWNVVL